MKMVVGRYHKQDRIVISFYMIILISLFLVSSCTGAPCDNNVFVEQLDEEDTGEMTDSYQDGESIIPPVDQQVPAKLETATLAMG
jgi:hypothetical protein